MDTGLAYRNGRPGIVRGETFLPIGFHLQRNGATVTADDLSLDHLTVDDERLEARYTGAVDVRMDVARKDSVYYTAVTVDDGLDRPAAGGVTLGYEPVQGVVSHKDYDPRRLDELDRMEREQGIRERWKAFRYNTLPRLRERSLRDWLTDQEDGFVEEPFAFPRHIDTAEDIPERTVNAILTDRNGAVAVAPDGTRGRLTYLSGSSDGIRSTTFRSTETAEKETLPGMAVAFADEPYAAVETLYSSIAHDRPPLPDEVAGLGYCTYNTFYRDVRAENVQALLGEAEDVPLRFLIVDDGWQDTRNGRLRSYNGGDGFPDMAGFVDAVKEEHGIDHVGLWHTLQGYWNGVAERLAPADATLDCGDTRLPDGASSFFADWYDTMREWGVDFVKVDNQTDWFDHVQGRYSMATHAEAVEAVHNAADTVIDCMSLGQECAADAENAVVRSSFDHLPRSPTATKQHLYANAYNAAWLSTYATPDYDMLDLDHPHFDAHATARVLSGGPFYLTGALDQVEKLEPYVLDDGSIPRPTEPGRPPIERLFADPYAETVPLVLHAPTGTGSVTAAFNITGNGDAVTATMGDAAFEPGQVLYDVARDELHTEPFDIELDELEHAVCVHTPVEDGFASIGLTDLVNPHSGVETVERASDRVEVELAQPGTYAFHTEADITAVRDGDGRFLPYRIEDSLVTVETDGTELRVELR